MSLDVALQSVAFYVLSCTTCTKVYHRHKAKQVAKKERAEKHALEMEQPGLYRHPSPFATNPYWEEEIQLGPGPPKKKGANKKTSSTAVNKENVAHTGHTGQGGTSVASSQNVNSSNPGSSPTMVPTEPRLSGENWNRKRYQREDEDLWGFEETSSVGQKIRDAIAKTESSVEAVGSKMREIGGRLSKSGPAREEERSPYYVARNPPVNDLHPPVVSSQPRDPGATAWMLQPPPAAKIMEGKQRASSTRSRSGSRTSSRLAVDNYGLSRQLSRQVTGRAVEKRLRRGQNPSDIELRHVPSRPESRSKTPAGSTTPKSTRSARMTRGRSHSVDSISSLSDTGVPSRIPSRRKRKPKAFTLVADDTASRYTIEHTPPQSSDTLVADRPESRDLVRPPLTTIVSSSEVVPHMGILGSSENKPPARQLLPSPMLDKPKAGKEDASSDLGTELTTTATVATKFPGAESYKFPPASTAGEEKENIKLNPATPAQAVS